MQYKALVTRMYSMADESLQIIIEDTDNFATFKQRVYDSLKIADYRANTQMRRLFEDTNLTDSLSYEELQAARKAAEYMYPLDSVPEASLNLGEKTAFEFSKNLASGEVLKLYIHDVQTHEELSKAIQEVWNLIDARLKRTNSRELKFMEYAQTIPYETRLKIAMIMDILYGRNTVENVCARLRQEDLESYVDEMRKEAAARGNNV